MNDPGWTVVARRVVEDVGVRAGELVLIRDGAGDPRVLGEVMLAVEELGAVPQVEATNSAYLRRLLRRIDPEELEPWAARRLEVMRQVDRLIKLAGDPLDLGREPQSSGEEERAGHGGGAGRGGPARGGGVGHDVAEAGAAWRQAVAAIGAVEDERRLPTVLVAVPTVERARALGMRVEELEGLILPALAVPADELRAEVDRVLPAVRGASRLTVQTGAGCELRLPLGDRPWHADDGMIDGWDLESGGQVANLPAGAIYTTVPEDGAEGDLWLEEAGPAREVRLRFQGGRVTEIEAAQGAAELEALFDGESGESRRISHLGVGLNPVIRRQVGWVLVDEHSHGALIVAFGENRYLGGRNASSLNVDFWSGKATVSADGLVVVERGSVVSPLPPNPLSLEG